MDRSQHDWNYHAVWCKGLAILAVLAGLSWYLWPSKVELSPGTYDIAIALYRVCNQQDEEGLEQIQHELRELSNPASEDDSSITHMQRIVDRAQAGDWTSAMRSARKALEDQVSGS